jgi:hypothetical protein
VYSFNISEIVRLRVTENLTNAARTVRGDLQRAPGAGRTRLIFFQVYVVFTGKCFTKQRNGVPVDLKQLLHNLNSFPADNTNKFVPAQPVRSGTTGESSQPGSSAQLGSTGHQNFRQQPPLRQPSNFQNDEELRILDAEINNLKEQLQRAALAQTQQIMSQVIDSVRAPASSLR